MSEKTPTIWLPKSEMNVSVRDGVVSLVETMTMKETPLASRKPTGFKQ
jgi:hypothetical protein